MEQASSPAFPKAEWGGLTIELVGVNVGGTTTTAVRGDAMGAIAAARAFPSDVARGPEPLYADIADAIRSLLTASTVAIGVAIGGPLDAKRGIVLDAPHLPFRSFPLLERLRGDFAFPIRVHHDAAACAMAEWLWGEARGVAGLAYLTCGTGFGVGLVLDGRVRYGSSGHSPEIGHVRYRASGPDIFGKPGCFEGFASAKSLALLAREYDPDDLGAASPAAIAERARAGETNAMAVLRENQHAVGAACAMLADLLALDAIVLGSLSRYLGEAWLAGVRETFEREVLPAHIDTCRLLPAMERVQDRSGLAAARDAVA